MKPEKQWSIVQVSAGGDAQKWNTIRIKRIGQLKREEENDFSAHYLFYYLKFWNHNELRRSVSWPHAHAKQLIF